MDLFHQHPQYEYVRELGSGAFGRVVLARNVHTKAYAAIKLIPRGYTIDERVEQELLNHRLLDHPHIVRLEEVFLINRFLCLVLEYADKGNLHSFIRERGKLTEGEARWVLQQTVSALDYMHRSGFANRDVKAENLVVMGAPREAKLKHMFVVKCVDLGFSKSTDEDMNTRLGSEAYMAPEVLSAGLDGYDGTKADIWSAGILLYVMLVGQYPGRSRSLRIQGEGLQRGPYQLDGEVQALINGMTQRDPVKRYGIKDILADPWFNKELPYGILETNDKFLAKVIPQHELDTHAAGLHQIIEKARQKPTDYTERVPYEPLVTPKGQEQGHTGRYVLETAPIIPMAAPPLRTHGHKDEPGQAGLYNGDLAAADTTKGPLAAEAAAEGAGVAISASASNPADRAGWHNASSGNGVEQPAVALVVQDRAVAADDRYMSLGRASAFNIPEEEATPCPRRSSLLQPEALLARKQTSRHTLPHEVAEASSSEPASACDERRKALLLAEGMRDQKQATAQNKRVPAMQTLSGSAAPTSAEQPPLCRSAAATGNQNTEGRNAGGGAATAPSKASAAVHQQAVLPSTSAAMAGAEHRPRRHRNHMTSGIGSVLYVDVGGHVNAGYTTAVSNSADGEHVDKVGLARQRTDGQRQVGELLAEVHAADQCAMHHGAVPSSKGSNEEQCHCRDSASTTLASHDDSSSVAVHSNSAGTIALDKGHAGGTAEERDMSSDPAVGGAPEASAPVVPREGQQGDGGGEEPGQRLAETTHTGSHADSEGVLHQSTGQAGLGFGQIVKDALRVRMASSRVALQSTLSVTHQATSRVAQALQSRWSHTSVADHTTEQQAAMQTTPAQHAAPEELVDGASKQLPRNRSTQAGVAGAWGAVHSGVAALFTKTQMAEDATGSRNGSNASVRQGSSNATKGLQRYVDGAHPGTKADVGRTGSLKSLREAADDGHLCSSSEDGDGVEQRAALVRRVSWWPTGRRSNSPSTVATRKVTAHGASGSTDVNAAVSPDPQSAESRWTSWLGVLGIGDGEGEVEPDEQYYSNYYMGERL